MERTAYRALLAWLVLVLLTLLTYAAGKAGLGGHFVIAGILLSVAVKGQLVADVFMGLKGVRRPWRWMVSGWLLVVLVLIGVAYATGET
jgi:hypothetical protein